MAFNKFTRSNICGNIVSWNDILNDSELYPIEIIPPMIVNSDDEDDPDID